MTFSISGLSAPVLNAVNELGYQTPTPIQRQAIPAILEGRNILATAQTGSGKTAGFILPILEKLSSGSTARAKRIRALVLVPTRELAIQVNQAIEQYGKHLSLRSMAMFGGNDAEQQKQALIDGVDILVATPGRLLDMLYQRAVYFDELEFAVLDEADRMLDMGFIADIRKIMERFPSQRQSLLFTATMNDSVRRIAEALAEDALEISIQDQSEDKPRIEQWLIPVDKDQKSALLSHLIQDRAWQQALIFIRTKHGAAKLADQLGKRGIRAEAIHGDRSQAMREQLLEEFKAGQLPFLVATGVAARGIDIEQLDRVVNYDLPDDAEDYVHRIGRTGRAGAEGEAVSLLSKDDFKRLCAIESLIGHLLERRDEEGFQPRKPVPVSILNYVPKHKRDAQGQEGQRGAHEGRKKRSAQVERKSQSRRSASGQGADNRGGRRGDHAGRAGRDDNPWKRGDSSERTNTGDSDPWAAWGDKKKRQLNRDK